MLALSLALGALVPAPVPQQPLPIAEGTLWRSIPAQAPSPDSASLYKYDDGAPEQGIGYATPTDIVWLQYFDPIPASGQDTLHTISTMNGRLGSVKGVPVGTQGFVVLWDDPNDDGFPHDCKLMAVSPWTVQFKNQDIFEPIAISPTIVSSRFFIGAWVQAGLDMFPAPLDNNMPSAGRAWLQGAATGTFDPNNISCCYGLTEVGAGTTFNGVWCLRADGSGTAPIPFCTSKAGLACGPATISAAGLPSASAASGFVISSGPARSCKSGILLYNTSALGTAQPFQGGTLCVNPASIRRAGPTNSEGTPGGASCDGEFVIDLNTFGRGAWVVPDCAGMPSGLQPNNPAAFLSIAGQTVFVQFWGRDSVATGSFLSSGLQFVLEP